MQHSPDFVGDGWIRGFDSDRDFTAWGIMRGGGRVAVRAHTDSMEVLFPTAKSDSFYTEAGRE